MSQVSEGQESQALHKWKGLFGLDWAILREIFSKSLRLLTGVGLLGGLQCFLRGRLDVGVFSGWLLVLWKVKHTPGMLLLSVGLPVARVCLLSAFCPSPAQ